MNLRDLPDFSSLDITEVAATRAEIAQRLAELLPGYETSRGAIADLVVRPDAYAITAARTVIDQLIRAGSLAGILEDPALADATLVDRLLSNYGLTRQLATVAGGEITIVLDGLAPAAIPAGTAFLASDARFVAPRSFAARTSEATVTSADDRVLRPIAGGRYAFTIPVVAAAPGISGMLRRGQALVPELPLFRVAQVYATADFTGGMDAETNAALVRRLQDGAAARTPSNRMTLRGLVRSNPAFASTTSISILGFGDAEQRRGQRSLLPVALPGRVDVLARTARLPLRSVLIRTATYIGTVGGIGLWQFAINRTTAPGFYDLPQIAPVDTPEGDNGFMVHQEFRALDLATPLPQSRPPDLDPDRPEEGAYSPFQTAVIQFLDPETATTGLVPNSSHKDYQVVVRALPQIADLHTYLTNRDRVDPSCDLLVRAPVPCDVSLVVQLLRSYGASTVDEVTIRDTLASAVNATGFTGRLEATDLAIAVHQVLPEGYAITRIEMTARILRPVAERSPTNPGVTTLRSTEYLQIPDQPASGVTPRTVCFYLDPRDVAIQVEAASMNYL